MVNEVERCGRNSGKGVREPVEEVGPEIKTAQVFQDKVVGISSDG